jgi:hypothetical protein
MITINTTTPDGVGAYLIRSSDSWAIGIANNYSQSARMADGFLSFCLEYNEHFYSNSYNFSISSSAVRGGEVDSDPVSVGAGYLYSLYATGNLVGTPELIQRTIWYLEDERPDNPGVFDTLLSQKFGSVHNSKMDFVSGESAATYGVQVINVGDYPNYAGQDQLVYGASESASWMACTVLVALVAIAKWRAR